MQGAQHVHRGPCTVRGVTNRTSSTACEPAPASHCRLFRLPPSYRHRYQHRYCLSVLRRTHCCRDEKCEAAMRRGAISSTATFCFNVLTTFLRLPWCWCSHEMLCMQCSSIRYRRIAAWANQDSYTGIGSYIMYPAFTNDNDANRVSLL